MLSWWKSQADQSKKSGTKSPTKSPVRGDVSNKMSVSTNYDTVSRKPSDSTIVSKKSSYNLPPPDNVSKLSSKDVLFVLVEIVMTYTSHVIRKRKSDAHSYKSQLWKTRREIEVDLLFMQGWASIGSLLTGVLADGFTGSYYMALISILIVFSIASCLYIEQILISRLKSYPYSEVFTDVASVAHLLNHSTGFSRVVFGLENLRNKKPSAISLILFIFTVTGDTPVSGGILMLIIKSADMSVMGMVKISWWSSMISAVLFALIFKSTATADKSYKAASRRVIKCIFDGLWHLCTDRLVKKDWKDHVHRRYDKLTLTRAKGLVYYFILLLPIAGFLFFCAGTFDGLYNRVLQVAKPVDGLSNLNVSLRWDIVIILAMLTTYFLLIPGLAWCGLPKTFNFHFSLGYFSALCALYYVALVLKTNEFDYSSDIAYIRIYNARDEYVRLVPKDTSLMHLNHTIPPHAAVMGSYVVVDDTEMILLMVIFDETNFTVFVRAEPKKCVSYVIVDPPAMIRISGDVPLFEGPAQTNDHEKARIYLFNAARDFGERTILIRDLITGQWIMSFQSLLGDTVVFQVPPGKYELRVDGTDVHLLARFAEGGLYGVMLLADISRSFLELDVVIPGKHIPAPIFTVFAALNGLSLALALVSLRTMTYTKAPSGLLNTSFGILYAQENVALWILVVGYNTWHKMVLGGVLLTYSIVLTFLFFMSLFIMMKYKQFYS